LLFLGVLSFVFLVIITCLFIKILNLPQFNFYTNCCKIGRKEIPFNDIIALQIIGETVTRKKRSYMSYELNILRSNYTRVNLLDHGNLKQLTNDAIHLSNALNVPVISLEDYPNCKKQLEEYYKQKQVKSLVIISCVFACFSLLVFTIGVIIPVVKSLQTNNWVEVDAKVVESYVRTYTNKKRQKTYSLNLRAQYTYNNRSYTCSKYSYLDSSSRSSLNKIVRANPVGKKIKCYVNSNNPKESIISRAISIREALSVVFISLVSGSLSSLLFFFRHKIANPNKGKINTFFM
jgi:hypothetical protein